MSFENNQLTGKLPTLKGLDSLLKLLLGNNHLSGDIEYIGVLKCLETISLQNNRFEGSASILKSFQNLRSIELSLDNFSDASSLGLKEGSRVFTHPPDHLFCAAKSACWYPRVKRVSEACSD
ncbi:MAG: hypothetical protein AAF512_21195 [Pseudomonadota bacterium]